ncbi:hypothetical protein HMPREF1554_01460 [Porphyromonas gingivalis F0569]|nr:hypothetical protein HMPREF1554_01460 [Porphyromonas gingivalis F0569]
MPYGIVHLPVRTATFGQKQIRISMLVRSKQKQGTPICLRILGH